MRMLMFIAKPPAAAHKSMLRIKSDQSAVQEWCGRGLGEFQRTDR